jgi:hypothetical protein
LGLENSLNLKNIAKIENPRTRFKPTPKKTYQFQFCFESVKTKTRGSFISKSKKWLTMVQTHFNVI